MSLSSRYKHWRENRKGSANSDDSLRVSTNVTKFAGETVQSPIAKSVLTCAICKHDDKPGKLWKDFDQLKWSAASGSCLGCRVIHAGLDNFVSRNGHRGYRYEDVLKLRNTLDDVTSENKELDVEWHSRTDADAIPDLPEYSCFEFYTDPEDKGDFDLGIKQRPTISGNTGSPAATKWAADCLDQCVNNHSLCANDRGSILPTRVLDIMPGNPVQLYEPKEGEKGTYCSLSHCWGPTQPIITTIKNFKARKHGVPWPSLSQTFQDAIKFTRALGIRYIWIDSLCIIQDDPEDWKRESAKMYKIYTHSILTLAATKSSDGYGGCFTTSDSAYRGYEVRDEYGGKTVSVHVRKKLQHDFYRENMQAEEQLPLLGRGWALQERFLPPRVLHFGPQELFWECTTHFCCECGTAELEKPSRKSEFHSALAKESDLALSRFWRDLVVGYSRLKFTFESDRLQAFRGIAELFKRHRGFEADQYVSGIWKESIIYDLLWSVHLTQLEQQPRRNEFPTWCWAAASVPIEYAHFSDHKGSKYTKQITVHDNHIHAEGRLMPVRLQRCPPTPNWAGSSHVLYELIPQKSEDHLTALVLKFDADYILTDSTEGNNRHVPEGSTLFCFPLLETEHWAYALVLSMTSGIGTFQRVGLVRLPVTHMQAWLVGAKLYNLKII